MPSCPMGWIALISIVLALLCGAIAFVLYQEQSLAFWSKTDERPYELFIWVGVISGLIGFGAFVKHQQDQC